LTYLQPDFTASNSPIAIELPNVEVKGTKTWF